MNEEVQKLIEEWRETNERFMSRLVQIVQATAAQTFMEQMLANMGAVAATKSGVIHQDSPHGRAEARKQELLARSNRQVPKLSGDVTIKNPAAKTEAAIIDQEDKNYGLLGSGCVMQTGSGPRRRVPCRERWAESRL